MKKQVSHRCNRFVLIAALAIACLMVWHSPLFVESSDGSDADAEALTASTIIASIDPDERAKEYEKALNGVNVRSERAPIEPWTIQSPTKRARSRILRGCPDRVTESNQESQLVSTPLAVDRHFAGILTAARYGGPQIVKPSGGSGRAEARLPVDRHFAGILAAAGYGGPQLVKPSGGSRRAEARLPVDRHFAGILAAAGYGGPQLVKTSGGPRRAEAPLPVDRHFAGILAAAGYGGGHASALARTIPTAKGALQLVRR